MIVGHFLSVLDNPFANLGRVDLLILLAYLCCILVLLLCEPLSLLHCDYLLMLPLCLNINLVLLSLDRVKLALLTLNLPFKVSTLFSLSLLQARPILCFFLDTLHHGDLLCLHLRDL